MGKPTVSVIIPTYMGADFLGDAIQSVIDQTYPNFELIVVNDASPDHTSEVVKRFNDPRLIYLVHQENQGADVARYTGMQASSGEIIAFLDQDDYYHPEKLKAHIVFLERHPDIGITYNSRFELNYSSKTIRDLWRPPSNITLADLVLWFPISPSDSVIKRDWAFEMDLHSDNSRGSEISVFSDAFMSGCGFGFVDRALNYRRHHSRRRMKDLAGACESELNNQVKVFSDARCPAEVLALRDVAHSNIYKYWAYLAFGQGETALGQEFVREAVQLKPSMLEGKPCELIHFLLINCIDDESQNHEALLKRIFAQIPPEIAWLSGESSWAVAQGYLLKGTRAVIWNRPDDGRKHFEQAANLDARVDETFLNTLTHQLLNYETEFGVEATQNVLYSLTTYLENLGGRAFVRDLKSSYSVNRAFRSYHAGDYARVPTTILHALANNPKYLTNRGVVSILLRSTFGMWSKKM